MSNFWTVDPATNTKDIELTADGRAFKIWVKKELTVGEERSVSTAGFRSLMGFSGRGGQASENGPEIAIDWNRQSFARTATYLADWSLTDDGGNKMPLSRETIESLRPSVYAVIEEAISAHVAEMEALRKNARTGGGSPQAISA